MISCIVLSCAAEYTSLPILFAGTRKQYSKNAIPQLIKITIHKTVDLCFKCPYHAKVMKIFEIVSIIIGTKNLYIPYFPLFYLLKQLYTKKQKETLDI